MYLVVPGIGGWGGGEGGKWNVAKGNPVNIMYFFEEQLHDGLE